MRFLVVVGLVFFVVLALFAGYWLMSTDHATTVPPKPLFTYSQKGTFTYDAALKNNTLYNTTHLTTGNGTLFSSITEWVNVSFVYKLTANKGVNATSIASVAIFMQTPAWTKTLGSESARTSVADGTFATLGITYDLNVSNVTTLAAAIEKQTGYAPSSYQVIVAPSIRSSIGMNEEATGVAFDPSLTLSFNASQIIPQHLSSTSSGAFVPPGDPPTTGKSNVSVVAFLLLFAAVGGAAAMGYLAWATRGERSAPDFSAVTRPYEEAIVDARSPPTAQSLVPVRTWEDIVKAADTLGAPIVRVTRTGVSGPDSPAATSFYVLSGTTAFTFHHDPAGGPGSSAPPEALAPRASGPASPRSFTAAVRDWNARYPRIPGVDTSNLESFVEWSDRISDRLRWFRPSSSLRQDSEELLLRSIGLAQRGRLDAAWVILGQLYARLGPWDSPAKAGTSVGSGGAAPASAAGRPSSGPGSKGAPPKP